MIRFEGAYIISMRYGEGLLEEIRRRTDLVQLVGRRVKLVRVMAAMKEKYAGQMDFARASAVVKDVLSAPK